MFLNSQITVFDKLEFDPCVKDCDMSTFFGMIEFDPGVKECDMIQFMVCQSDMRR